MKQEETKSPVSFEVHVVRLPKDGLPVGFEADEKQREALAKAHGVSSVESYKTDLLVTAWKRHGVKVRGAVEANITQECVVSLEPIEAHIEEEVEGLFLPADSKLGRLGFDTGGELIIDADGADSPELFSGDTIDVGELAEQFFGLAIDPYPRKPGVTLDTSGDNTIEETDFQKKLREALGKS
jgi:hypothetical protein